MRHFIQGVRVQRGGMCRAMLIVPHVVRFVVTETIPFASLMCRSFERSRQTVIVASCYHPRVATASHVKMSVSLFGSL